MSELIVFAWYLLPMALVWTGYTIIRRTREKRARETLERSLAAGLSQSASLHPIIDESLCLGCNACVKACPEGEIIGLVQGKAKLIEPANCIGHGACATACPFNAITLVFGTEQRGIDIPVTTPAFETTQPGIYLAGELGGMGLVKNAIKQGIAACEAIAQSLTDESGIDGTSELYDVIIIGAGPAGIAAALSASEKALNYVVLEQDSLGGTVAHFPRRKLVMTEPAVLPLAGKMPFRETSKETLIEYWQDVAQTHRLRIEFGECVESIDRTDSFFTVTTSHNRWAARRVLLCLGRRGTPRKLEVPGEELSKVTYSLDAAEQYINQDVLVVGGGDSAIEAAISLAEAGARATVAYRGESFPRAKPANREKLEICCQQHDLDILFNTEVRQIEAERVQLSVNGEPRSISNGAVIICAGGVLPVTFLEEAGVKFETKYGSA